MDADTRSDTRSTRYGCRHWTILNTSSSMGSLYDHRLVANASLKLPAHPRQAPGAFGNSSTITLTTAVAPEHG